jgi:hypothetical protein
LSNASLSLSAEIPILEKIRESAVRSSVIVIAASLILPANNT